MGCRQAVRQRVLVSPFLGSNPSIPVLRNLRKHKKLENHLRFSSFFVAKNINVKINDCINESIYYWSTISQSMQVELHV